MLQRFGIFFLFEKENACKRKANCARKKASKHRLKASLFAPCCEKKRLKCESISARLFLACHQKSNAFKCKQFCCAKPTLAHLLAGGFAPRPRERRAAVHSLCYSVGSSAHSPANALGLERVRARAACCASRSALSKHSRLSPLERALCSLFFANIAPRFIRHRRRFGDVARVLR